MSVIYHRNRRCKRPVRLIIMLLAASMLFSIFMPNTAHASPQTDQTAFQQSRVQTNIVVQGNTDLYQYPSAGDPYSNPVRETMSGTRVASYIGRNGSGQYYYFLASSGGGLYGLASDLTPVYDSPGRFYIDITDSAGQIDGNSFNTAYKLQGTVYSAGGAAVSLDTLSVAVKNASGTQVTGGSVSPAAYGNYAITAGSSISSKVDFSKLTAGQSYTMTITASFTDHYYPVSSTSVGTRIFVRNWSKSFTVTQGTVSVSVSGLRVPTASMPYGESYTLKGTITASGAHLSQVSAYVYHSSDSSYSSPATGTYHNIDAVSYSIQNSTVDRGVKFATLSPGAYVYVLRATAGGQSFTLNTTNFSIEPRTYTVSYDAAGGSYTPSPQTKVMDVPLTLDSHTPSRTGYNFLYWRDGNGNTYQPGGTYTANSDDVLTAVWEARGYEVQYWCPLTLQYLESQVKVTDVPLTVKGYDLPEPEGAHFRGWKTEWGDFFNPSTVEYLPGSVYTRNRPVTFNAVFELDTYTISFDANGGTGAPASIQKQAHFDTSIPFTSPTRAGYLFLGWSTDPNAARPQYGHELPGSSWYYTANASATLYAVWAPDSEAFTITYDTQGKGSVSPQKQIKFINEDLTLSSSAPSYAGFIFMGWAHSPNAAAAEYQPGDIFRENASTTLYAVWEEAVTLKVEYLIRVKSAGNLYGFESFNGSPVLNPPYGNNDYSFTASFTFLAPKPQVLSETTTLADLGWYEEAIARLTAVVSEAEYNPRPAGFFTTTDGVDVEITPDTVITGDLTIKPYWAFDATIIQFNANGGSGAPSSLLKYNGTPITLPSEVPVREGYGFVGWSPESDAATGEYAAASVYAMDSDMILYAVWAPILDVNAVLDGEVCYTLEGIASFDIEINAQTITGLYDYWTPLTVGTTWSLSNIRPADGYAYDGIGAGSRTGTLTDPAVVSLSFHTVPQQPVSEPVRQVFGSHSYSFYNEPVTWYDAKTLCENLGGHLVAIESAEENAFLYSLIGADTNAWIGATDRDSEGAFLWITGDALSYSNWVTGQPDNWQGVNEGSENYVQISGGHGGQWNDNQSCQPLPFLCEFDRTSTVSYEPGTDSAAPWALEYAFGETVSIDTVIPYRYGYLFLGWAEEPDSAEPTYLPGDALLADDDMTLYAVWQRYDLVLPAALERIEQEAFSNGTFRSVWIPDSVDSIGEGAFSGCEALRYVYIPSHVSAIEANAFDSESALTIIGTPGSAAEDYANANGLSFVPVTGN